MLFILFAFLLQPAYGAECRHSGQRLSCVEFVDNYDGDTITFTIPRIYSLFGDRVRVRLQGVDAPEIKSEKSCERELAVKVKALVHAMLKKAKRIDLVNPKRDKYFRILADVQADGVSMSEWLLKNGWGIAYHGEAKPKYNWCATNAIGILGSEEWTEASSKFKDNADLPHAPFQGPYKFSGEIVPSQRVHNVRIYLNGSEAHAKMVDYINKGYICEKRMGQLVLCRLLMDLQEIPERALRSMRAQANRMAIEFENYQGSGNLITDGLTYREWEVPAGVSINGEHYDSYIFSKQSSGLIKAMMGYGASNRKYTFVVKDNVLKYQVRAVIEKEWEWNEYTGYADFGPSASE